MKFDITIKDANLEDLKRLMDVLSDTPAQNDVPKTVHGTELIEVTEPEQVAIPKTEQVKEVIISDSEQDIEGLPWDGRIHSPNRTTKADGTWRRRKGVSDEEYNNVKLELLSGEVTSTPEPVEVLNPPVQPELVPTVDPEPVAMNDFNSILARIQRGFSQGNINGSYVKTLVTRMNEKANVKMTAITDIVGNQGLIDIASELLLEDGI